MGKEPSTSRMRSLSANTIISSHSPNSLRIQELLITRAEASILKWGKKERGRQKCSPKQCQKPITQDPCPGRILDMIVIVVPSLQELELHPMRTLSKKPLTNSLSFHNNIRQLLKHNHQKRSRYPTLLWASMSWVFMTNSFWSQKCGKMTKASWEHSGFTSLTMILLLSFRDSIWHTSCLYYYNLESIDKS